MEEHATQPRATEDQTALQERPLVEIHSFRDAVHAVREFVDAVFWLMRAEIDGQNYDAKESYKNPDDAPVSQNQHTTMNK